MTTVTITEQRGDTLLRNEQHPALKPYQAFELLRDERTRFFGAHPICGTKRGRDGQTQWDEWTAPNGERVRIEITHQ